MYRRVFCIVIAFVIFCLWSQVVVAQQDLSKEQTVGSETTEINAKGQRLNEILDSMDVEHHWLAYQRINWETGGLYGKFVSSKSGLTHCSAFIAAVAKRLGIYILRPPQHPQNLLAKAQHYWFLEHGKEHGWEPVATGVEAQALANQGYLVVASYQSPDWHKQGHIAIVRPHSKSDAQIQKEGPQIIQAGIDNYNSTSVKEGFKHHPGAWEKNEILFFSHETKL